MNDTGVILESERFYRRLTETFYLFGKEVDPRWWWAILIPILALGLLFVVWMYIKDARTVHWYWALPLGILRCAVYGLIAYMFLLPSKQNWERTEKRSRVLVVLDVSDSMHTTDDPPDSARTESRLKKVLDYLSDDNVAFLKKLMDKNPVYVYRFGARLDEEPLLLEKQVARNTDGSQKTEYVPLSRVVSDPVDGRQRREYGKPFTAADWEAFTKYDFRQALLRGLSEPGQLLLSAHAAFDGKGDIEWARKWLEKKEEEVLPANLPEADVAALKLARTKLNDRIELARTIAAGTNVPGSLQSLVNREAGNMVQGIVVFSDGRNTLGAESEMAELRLRAKRESIPIFTVAVGEDRQFIALRITDVQAPDQTPPDEPFKIAVEVDGEGLVGQEVPVFLDIYPPKRDTPFTLEGKVKFAPGEPPHGQAEFVIDPSKLPEDLRSKESKFKDLIEGEWRAKARTPRKQGERFTGKEHDSEAIVMKIEKKPLRVLLFASGPTRDFQFLLNQMIRDKADMSVYLQNEGGTSGKIAMLDEPERLLNRFPNRLRIDEDAAATPEEKWLNLAKYDVIIAFDPDWSLMSPEQLQMLQTWVELQAGGLIYIAGPFHTKFLARQDDTGAYKPLKDILPVVPGDSDISTAKLTRDPKTPGRLRFDGLSQDTDFLRLDDDYPDDPVAGWERFFTGREKSDEPAKIIRGFYSYYPVLMVKPGASVVARFFAPQDVRPQDSDGKDPPFIVTSKFGQGQTVFVGSGEIWRIRQYRDKYFERFWTKMTRYVSTGSRRKQDRRGRILMSKEFSTGNYLRIEAQLFDAELKPVTKAIEPKMTVYPLALDKYQTKDIEKEHARYKKSFTLSAKAGRDEEWQGLFRRQVLATPELFPPGQWKLEVEIPASSEKLTSKFTIRPSNPETDNTRPDLAALMAMAGDLDEVATRINDKTIVDQLRQATPKTAEGQKLAFKFDNKTSLDLIPSCMVTETKTQRNRGAIQDQWDQGPKLPHAITDLFDKKKRDHHVGWMLLIVVTLLSAEWLTRKLLRLA